MRLISMINFIMFYIMYFLIVVKMQVILCNISTTNRHIMYIMYTRYVIYMMTDEICHSSIFFVIQISNWSLSWFLVQAGPGNIKHFTDSAFCPVEERGPARYTIARRKDL